MEEIIRTQNLPIPDLHQDSAPDFLPDPSMPPGFPFRSRFINIKNFRLHYVHEGSGPPLILLHGGGTWLYCFHKNIPVLSKHFSVYAIDVPGHGFTRALNGAVTYDFDTVCDAIRQFMDVMKIEKAHIAGHSWGGGWAIRFTGRHPERMLKLVLIDSSGINRHERLAWELLKYPVIGELLTHFLTRHSVKRGLTLSFYNQSLVTDELVGLMYAPLRNKDNRKAQLRYSRNIDWEKTKTALPDIHIPTQIIWGKQDRYIPVKFGKQMAQLMPDARLEIIDRCGHSAHNECPETVNRVIAEFLLIGDVMTGFTIHPGCPKHKREKKQISGKSGSETRSSIHRLFHRVFYTPSIS